MNLIKYESCDTATVHLPKEFFDNDKGVDFYLLMCFNTDFVYCTDNKMQRGEKYQCILHPPHTPLMHGPAPDMEEGFENDWIYFGGDGVAELIEELELPVNKSFFVENGNCLTAFICSLQREEKMPMHYSEYYFSSVIQDMLISIARQRRLAEIKDGYSYNSVRNVRKAMLENYYRKFDLKKLAEESGYSVSRFCELYKKFYNSSPIADLINMRINKAKHYLLFSDKQVSEISELCGFETVHYFSMMFKKQTGCSPLSYRCSEKADR